MTPALDPCLLGGFDADRVGWAFAISGAKRWTTLGPDSSLLLIVGALPPGDDTTRVQLKVARVPAGAPGVQLLPMPETRFVPEVPHARVQLDAVVVDAAALLPGDGYERYVKPFRTIEDAQVTLAVLACLLRESRARGWPSAFAERLRATIVVLAGALAQAHALYAEAESARGQRAARAWQRLQEDH